MNAMSSLLDEYIENPLTKYAALPIFTYSPVNTLQTEIRLIRFVRLQSTYGPPCENSVPCIELHHFTLANAPAYHALSYVWGKTTRNRPILLNNTKYSVTRNLDHALRRFANDENLHWLWADALCINQEDDVEKSSQIGMMRDIYRNACSVLAWLGSPSEGSDLLLRAIETEGKKLLRMGWSRLVARSLVDEEEPDWNLVPSSQCWKTFQSFSIIISLDRVIMSRLGAEFMLRNGEPGLLPHTPMLNFLSRPIWTRVWLVQELAVAKDVELVCGQTKLKYAHFLVVYFLYYRFYEDQRHDESVGENGGAFTEAISSIFPIFWQTVVAMRQQSYGPLNQLLSSVHRLGATDPRDLVYAVVGLANDSVLMGIKTDYTKSYGETSTELAWKLLQVQGLWILSYAHGLRDSTPRTSLPSWVPDWSLRTHATLNGYRFDGDVDFTASGISAMCTVPSIEDKDFHSISIKIKGAFIATITDVGSALNFNVPRVTKRNFYIARELVADLERLSDKLPPSMGMT